MSPEEINELLGGYATGTLTAEEQQALFAAALDDQDLFDALAREQSLRDLLRDPAARAELLSALDAPASRLVGFWQWLRRPAVASLATACVAAVAIVAVWQGTRGSRLSQAERVIVAELRSQPVPARPAAEIPPLARQSESGKRTDIAKAPPHAQLADKNAPPAAAPPRAGMPTLELRKDEPAVALAENAPPPPPPAPAAMPAPALMARKAKAEDELARQMQTAETRSVAVSGNAALDARALFYANQPASGANAFVPPSGSGGAAPTVPQMDAAPRVAKAVESLAATMRATAPRLGVRVSILRGTREVDLTTVLDPGETVRLRLTPNANGFLYVADGTRLVASGVAQRLRPFETPELRFDGSGQQHLYVMLSRSPQTVDPQSLGTLARGDLVETSASQDRATYYVVSSAREAGALQVVVPVTLTWR